MEWCITSLIHHKDLIISPSSYCAEVQDRDIELTWARSDGSFKCIRSFTDMSRLSQFLKSIQASLSSNAMDTKNSQRSQFSIPKYIMDGYVTNENGRG